MKINLSKIQPNPEQPRTVFNEGEISSLAESLKEDGLINPISVEGPGDGGMYTLLDGERRWRAAIAAGWVEIEADVRLPNNGSGKLNRLVVAMAGNLQRSDMGPIDEARAYQKLVDEGMSQADISRRVGRSTSNINMKLKMLDYPKSIQDLLNSGAWPVDERVNSALRKLSMEEQDNLALASGNRKLRVFQIIWLCGRIHSGRERRRHKDEGAEIFKSTCPPISFYPMGEQHAGLEEAFKKTCHECNLYTDGGVKTICAACPMVTFAKILEGKK